jgi:putative adenylate-forming enzyme
MARTQVRREQGPRAQLASHQQQRLETVVRHAASHSPFYRRWFAETGALGEEPVRLQRLPVLDKSLLVEHFDELVCDRRLRHDQLLDRAGQLRRDRLYLDRYRVLLTSGSSGRQGLFVYDTVGWRSIITQMLRSSSWAGLAPSLPRQRVAWIGGAGPSHVTRQAAATLSIGVHRVLALPATLPLPELVEALNRFQPTYLNVYPSVAIWLADEQQAGRLRLSPQMLVTVGELRTPAMTQRLADAFGVDPFDVYGSTEGLFGSECQHHQGIHLFEDITLVENVDGHGQPVPAGQPGARLLVTNLYNLVQPLLRLEVTDLVTLDPDPCPCGRSLVRARTIAGRSDDLLSLPTRDGGRVAVHPLHFALLTRDPEVREFQVVQDGPVLRILIVPSPAVAEGDERLETRLAQAVAQQLLRLGVHDPQITVERRLELPRSPGGKLKLVIADSAARPTHAVAR